MVSPLNCWNCDKKLNHENDDHFFWCNKSCHDEYDKKATKIMNKYKKWSEFMAGQGPCPRDMKHLAPPEKKSFSKPKKEPQEQNKRTCKKCGKPGHNARSCGKQRKRPPKKKRNKNGKKVSTKRATNIKHSKSTRKKRRCGKCKNFGHNARTCKK